MWIRGFLALFLFLASVDAQHLFLAGGGLTAESYFFWNRLILFAGGRGQAKIGVITAARDDPEEASKELKTILMNHGARQVTWIPVSGSLEDSANNETVAAMIMKQSAIFIDDGDVHRLIRVLRNADGTDTIVLAALREKFQRGVISGNGAGSAALSGTPLPVSGHSYETLVHGTKAYTEPAPGRRGGANRRFAGCSYLTSGLGFLRSWLIEPHFNEHSLHGRTIRLLLDTRGAVDSFGLGIDREMAIAIYRVGSEQEYAEVLGNKGGISIINTTKANFATSPKLHISGVQITFLTEDDKILLGTEEVLPATWKADLAGEEWHILATPSEDIFSADKDGTKGNFNRVAKRLFDSQLSKKVSSVTWQSSPQFLVDMDSRSGESFHNDSPSNSQHLISYARLSVSISQIA
ncbi:cyanophycinase isoform X2 [Daphnia magna]|uniref:cyanophycinase isoform X2 n=1 Tax=Daphnia magna TaxID=35525 RepID=UPI00140257EF|nr:cyanophycinase isoform X2 [Daphnia magna]